MKAIQDVERYIREHPGTASARLLARLPPVLSREERLDLRDLYALDWESFELAIELLRDWRIDRYYTERSGLFAAPALPSRGAVVEAAE